MATPTPEFLAHLKSLYPNDSPLQNPWYFVAAVAFSASNLPEAVPAVFQFAANDLQSQSSNHADALSLVRKIKDSLFKSGILSGYPKVMVTFQHCINSRAYPLLQAINALSALHETLPEALRDDKPLR
jgi:hypothetical protein